MSTRLPCYNPAVPSAEQAKSEALRAESLMHDSVSAVVRERESASPIFLLPSKVAQQESDDGLYQHFRELDFAQKSLFWLKASISAIVLLGLLFWAGAVVAWLRPRSMLVGQPSIQDAVRSELVRAFVPNRDPLEFFVRSVLTDKNSILKSAKAPGMDAMRGLVSPVLLEKWEVSLGKNANTINQNQVTQSVVISSIGGIIENKEEGKVAVVVTGLLVVHQQVSANGPTVRILDYAAKAVVEPNRPTAANHQHFYLVGLEERVGPSAYQWAKEQAQQ